MAKRDRNDTVHFTAISQLGKVVQTTIEYMKLKQRPKSGHVTAISELRKVVQTTIEYMELKQRPKQLAVSQFE